MIYQAIDICPNPIPFVDYIFRQNNEALHGGQVSIAEWLLVCAWRWIRMKGILSLL